MLGGTKSWAIMHANSGSGINTPSTGQLGVSMGRSGSLNFLHDIIHHLSSHHNVPVTIAEFVGRHAGVCSITTGHWHTASGRSCLPVHEHSQVGMKDVEVKLHSLMRSHLWCIKRKLVLR